MSVKNRIRNVQDHFFNSGWRIEYVSFGDDGSPMVNGPTNIMGWIAILGMLMFIGGMSTLVINGVNVDRTVSLMLCVGGFGIAAFGAIFKEKLRVKHWFAVDAVCIDFEARYGVSAAHQQGIWGLRALCEFEFQGKNVRCTPEMTWSKRLGEERKSHYILESKGRQYCRLLVNPDNPKQVRFAN